MRSLILKSTHTFVSLVLIAWLGSGNVLAQSQLHVEESVELSATPTQVWATLGQFGSLAWHPAVASTQVSGGKPNHPGSVRSVTVKDGARIVEELQRYNAATRTLSYRIVESPLPVLGYVSTLKVMPSKAGAKVVWRSDFVRNPQALNLNDEQVRDLIAGIYKTGFEGLRAVFPQH
jgi:mxaD protein